MDAKPRWNDVPERWRTAQVLKRYTGYCREHRAKPRELVPQDPLDRFIVMDPGDVLTPEARFEFAHLMRRIIAAIKDGDAACADLGIDLICEDRGFIFGALLKSEAACALRQAPTLTSRQKGRIRLRAVRMLQTGIVPREYREYSRLLRHVGIGDLAADVRNAVPGNHFAMRAKRYLLRHVLEDDAS